MNITGEYKESTATEIANVIPIGELQSFNPEQELERGQRAAKALMKVTKPIDIHGKKYLRFEDWQTLGRFYNLTVGVEMTAPMWGEAQGELLGFSARAWVKHNDKIISNAEASCKRDEPNWSNRPEFMLKSMAQTRACAKALRNVLSWVAVLAGFEGTPAEEMDNDQAPLPEDESDLASQESDAFPESGGELRYDEEPKKEPARKGHRETKLGDSFIGSDGKKRTFRKCEKCGGNTWLTGTYKSHYSC